MTILKGMKEKGPEREGHRTLQQSSVYGQSDYNPARMRPARER
jgi:hypothetical protein